LGNHSAIANPERVQELRAEDATLLQRDQSSLGTSTQQHVVESVGSGGIVVVEHEGSGQAVLRGKCVVHPCGKEVLVGHLSALKAKLSGVSSDWAIWKWEEAEIRGHFRIDSHNVAASPI